MDFPAKPTAFDIDVVVIFYAKFQVCSRRVHECRRWNTPLSVPANKLTRLGKTDQDFNIHVPGRFLRICTVEFPVWVWITAALFP